MLTQSIQRNWTEDVNIDAWMRMIKNYLNRQENMIENG